MGLEDLEIVGSEFIILSSNDSQNADSIKQGINTRRINKIKKRFIFVPDFGNLLNLQNIKWNFLASGGKIHQD